MTTNEFKKPVYVVTSKEEQIAERMIIGDALRYLFAAKKSGQMQYVKGCIDMAIRELEEIYLPDQND